VSHIDEFDVFDVHQHVGKTMQTGGDDGAKAESGVRLDPEELKRRLETMEVLGIQQAMVSPGYSYNRADGIAATRRQNDAIAAYRDAMPDRFPIAAGVVEPRDEAAGLAEIDRMSDELGLAAINLHTQHQGVGIDDPWVVRYLDRAGERGMVPFVHAADDCWQESLWSLAKVARALPDLTIVALEPFLTLEGQRSAPFFAELAPNLLFDTASCTLLGMLKAFVKQVGAERVVYGSQTYSYSRPPRPGLGKQALVRHKIAGWDLSQEERAAILGGNARRLFGAFLFKSDFEGS
jgi:predicted TIM-barrel fold metal-dependent hydrolase